MSIHWYPGHMHKARKEMIKALPTVDLVIEILDARIPHSSENPVIASLRTKSGYTKPCIKVLNKTDLADPVMTQQWIDTFKEQHNVTVIPVTTTQPGQVKQLIAACRELFPDKKDTPIYAMIAGIPNVGKSTLINILAGRTVAKTGNEAAVTKHQQRIDLGNGIVLLDTPGILWPKIDNENSSYRLATLGSIKDTAMNYDDVAFFLAEHLITAYPNLLRERYDINQDMPDTPLEFLELIGVRRGCLRKKGLVDIDKISTILVNELRNGTLGHISLETPDMIAQEMIEVERIKKEKAEKKAARKKKFKDSKQ